ncbi:MAG: M67 family metallopeptidase [Candidatus Helarchaeales archaeon]
MPLKQIKLLHRHLKMLQDWSRKNSPREACALLLGTISNEIAIVKKVRLTENVEKSTIRFSIDPEELYSAYLEAEREGMEVVGVFHSHPAVARPSGIDLEYMKINPIAWVIQGISSASKENILKDCSAFQYENGNLHELELKILEDSNEK